MLDTLRAVPGDALEEFSPLRRSPGLGPPLGLPQGFTKPLKVSLKPLCQSQHSSTPLTTLESLRHYPIRPLKGDPSIEKPQNNPSKPLSPLQCMHVCKGWENSREPLKEGLTPLKILFYIYEALKEYYPGP